MSQEQASVGLIDTSPSLSTLSKRIVLALAGHPSTPRTVVLQGQSTVEDFLSCAEPPASANIVPPLFNLDNEPRDTAAQVVASSVEELSAKLEAPRCVLLFGEGSVQMLRELQPHLVPGDTVIVAASRNLPASDAIVGAEVVEGVHLLHCGFGTVNRAGDGLSITVSCDESAWSEGIAVEILKQLAASDGGATSVTRVGDGAVSHLVQLVHDTTELSILQLINEASNMLVVGLRFSCGEVADVLESWSKSRDLFVEGYLLETTREALRNPEPVGDHAAVSVVVGRVADSASQILSLGLRNGAVMQTHSLSMIASCANKSAGFRAKMSTLLSGPGSVESALDRSSFVDLLGRAMAASLVLLYAQAFDLLRTVGDMSSGMDRICIASVAKAWSLQGDALFSTRAKQLAESFTARDDFMSVLEVPECQRCVEDQQLAWRQIIAQGVLIGVPLPTLMCTNDPAFCGCLHYYDTLRDVRMTPGTMLASQLEHMGYTS